MRVCQTQGRVLISQDTEDLYKVFMGNRFLGFIHKPSQTFRCFRKRGRCDTERCKDCQHPCHYFKLYGGYGLNLELLVMHERAGFQKVTMILSDYSSGERIQRLMTLGEEHWVFQLEPDELAKKAVKENGYETQVVVPEGEFGDG